MTPAVRCLKQAKVSYTLHEYDHDPGAGPYGEEAAEKLGVPENSLFKTLVVDAGKKGLAVAMVPVAGQLDLKAFARALGAKKVKMADAGDVERITGYVKGGVSVLGQKKKLPVIMDASAETQATVFASAGRRGLQMEVAPSDLKRLTGGVFEAITTF